MKPKRFMLIAGEASGDLLAAELVQALRDEFNNAEAMLTPDYQPLHASLEPRFFGAGGPRMAAAGVELAFDLTEHSVIGISDVLKNYFKFRRLFTQLFRLALERQPDAIICVDFSGFNRRFAQAIKSFARSHRGWFHDWDPKLIQYVSPQVWASREGRAYQMARDYDLLLSIFPFEKAWYVKRVPRLQVDYVGHPILDRYKALAPGGVNPNTPAGPGPSPMVLLLPGSRPSELARHLPVMLGALAKVRAAKPGVRARMVLPNEGLSQRVKVAKFAQVDVQVGGLADALKEANVAIASTGTVTMECAYFGVPTVALYKTSWSTYQIGKQIVKVKYLAMPNLLANEEVFPEFVQGAATPENLAHAALELMGDESRRLQVKTRLTEIIASLGDAGASQRAARAVVGLLESRAVHELRQAAYR